MIITLSLERSECATEAVKLIIPSADMINTLSALPERPGPVSNALASRTELFNPDMMILRILLAPS